MNHRRHSGLVVAAWLLAAAGTAQAQSAKDPLESWNRAVFGFNESLDAAVLEPVASGYKAVVPELVRSGVGNVFNNFSDIWSAVNQMLQGKPVAAAQMGLRVATNTLFGIAGLFDVASDLGIERQREDFGQTLGRWGLPAGPYLVTPLLGPSSLRDAAAMPLDLSWRPAALSHDSATRVGLSTLQLIDVRAGLLDASRIVDDIALDKYVFVRDAYLARRRSLVYDGDPPDLPEPGDAAGEAPAAPK
ncbi:MAG: VacJ family lipoprotein [Burkholderiaceae bacterium]|nr:VacJ family lipoprotein [Burkholderiaceae bacterium]